MAARVRQRALPLPEQPKSRVMAGPSLLAIALVLLMVGCTADGESQRAQRPSPAAVDSEDPAEPAPDGAVSAVPESTSGAPSTPSTPTPSAVVEVYDWADLYFVLSDLWVPAGLEVSSSSTGIIDWEWLCGNSPAVDAITFQGEVPAEAREACRVSGRELSQHAVGYRAVSVLRSPTLALDCVSERDLYAIWGPESDDLNAWSEIAAFAADLGSATPFPDGEAALFGPGEEADGYDVFVERGLERMIEERRSLPVTRPDYAASSTAANVVTGIESTPGSIGFASFLQARIGPGIEVVDVNWGAGCVEPTVQSVADGTYALSEPVHFLWTDAFPWPQAVDLLQESAAQVAQAAGLVPPR